MAPAYKLIYFESRGAAEPARFLFKYGGIDFQDVRVKREDWPQMKEKTPFGQLPVLEHNGKQVGQSISIHRYLAQIVKLAGNDDWENLEIDAVVDTIRDLVTKIGAVAYETDEAKKSALMETIIKETFPYYLTRFDALVEKNKGHLALGRLTWVDLMFVAMYPTIEKFTGQAIFEKYSNLKALEKTVTAIPAIKEWIEVRPKTDF